MTQGIQNRIEQIWRGEVPDGYKKTKVGIIPMNWGTTCFKKKFNRLMRKNTEGNTNVLTISAQYGLVNQEEFFNKSVASDDKTNYFLLYQGEYAYNKSYSNGYPFGAIKKLDKYEKGIVSPLYICFSAGKDNKCPEYYLQYFEAGGMNSEIQAFAQEGARNHGLLNISVDDFFNSILVEPPLAEQERIAEILETQDRVIALCEKKVDELKKQKKVFLQKMFPKPGATVPEWRFPGFTDAWEQRKLGEVASSFEYGLNAAAKEFDGVNKYLRITDIDDSSRVFKDDDLTSPDTDLSTASNYLLHDGEILFARTGASVGKSFIYRESDGLVYFAGFLIRAKIKPEYDPEFVFQNTLGVPYEKYIQITSQRSGQPGVNAQEYGEYTFLVPEYAEQKKIGGFLRQIDNLITLHQRKCDEEKQNKKALMQLLLTGIVRI